MLKDFKNKEVGSIINGSKNHTKIYTFPEWKSKGVFDDVIKLIIKINNKRLCPGLKYDGFKSILEFGGRCLEKKAHKYDYGKIINIYIVYELSPDTNNYEFTLENCLSGSVAVAKDSVIDKYEYSEYGLDLIHLFPDGSFVQNAIIFGVDISSSLHADNKTKVF